MREDTARLSALGTGMLVAGAAFVFGWLQQAPREVALAQSPRTTPAPEAPPVELPADPPLEPGPPPDSAPEPVVETVEVVSGGTPEAAEPTLAATLEVGRRVYDEQRCARCHSIAGVGSPRSPLDGVGDRLTPEGIRLWIVDPQAAQPGIRKPAFDHLPALEVDALVAYMRSLRD